MKWVLMMLAVLPAGGALAASAAEKHAAMHHLATIMAAQNLCASVEPDTARMAMISQLYGIKTSGADMDLIMADARQQIADMRGMDQAAVCASALALYGPKGINVPGMLRSK